MYLELQFNTTEFPFSSECFGTSRDNLQHPDQLPQFLFGDLHETFNFYLVVLLLEQHLPVNFREKLIEKIRPTDIGAKNFFGDIGGNVTRYPNDAETTAVYYHALLKTNVVTEMEIEAIARSVYDNVNDDGLISLYYVPKDHSRYNRLDAVCMINMVRFAYAQRHERFIERSEDYIFDWLSSGNYKSGTLYYPSPYTFLYFCSQLASTNYLTKTRFTGTLRREFNQIEPKDLKYPLDYALIILTGIELEIRHEYLIGKLLDMQNDDGSWPADAMYMSNQTKIHFGSACISTIFSVLALIETI